MKRVLAASLLTVGLAAPAHAATISGSSSGGFTSEDAPNTIGCFFGQICEGADQAGISANSEILFWPYRVCDGGCTPGIARSSLKFQHYSFGPVDLMPGDYEVRVGDLRWYNARSLTEHTPAEFNARGQFDLTFTHPAAATTSLDLLFNIVSTSNVEGQSDDEIRIAGANGPLTFPDPPVDLGGGLTLTGFSFTASGAGLLRGGVWLNPEDGLSWLHVNAHVTLGEVGQGGDPVLREDEQLGVVPLPAPIWLLLAGIGGLAALGRTRGRS